MASRWRPPDERRRLLTKAGAEETNLENSGVGGLVTSNDGELIGNQLGIKEARGSEVGRLELLQRLSVELGFQLLEDMSKLCTGQRQISVVPSPKSCTGPRTKSQNRVIARSTSNRRRQGRNGHR